MSDPVTVGVFFLGGCVIGFVMIIVSYIVVRRMN